MKGLHALLGSLGFASLTACVYSVTPAGPTYLGDGRELARLHAISLDPTDHGTTEAVNMWSRHPDWDAARLAVFAAIPTHTGPLEERFHKLAVEQQRTILAHTATLTGPEVSALVMRLSAAGGLVEEGIAALAGKQDEQAVSGLLSLARSGPEPIRVLAIAALEPPATALASDGLLSLALPVSEPQAVRNAALDVLAPYDKPQVRAQVLGLARDEDSAVAAFAWDRFDLPQGATEVDAALTATTHATAAAAAVRFLNRAEVLPASVTERLVAMASPTAAPSDPGDLAARYEAARALVGRGDDRGGPALVLLLSDDEQRAPSAAVLDGWILEAVPALRQYADAITAPAGRAEAARLLARFGGPEDQALVAKLAPEGERAELLATLPNAPWGLFPSGSVTYAPADGATSGVVTQTLLEAVASGRALRSNADPTLAYVGAARAFLAGGRSTSDREALASAASAARSSFGLWMTSSLPASTWHGERIADISATTLGDRMGIQVRRAAPPAAALPTMTLGGDVRCQAANRTEQQPLMDTAYYYTVTVANPRKDELARQVQSVPYDKRVDTSCERTCHCYVTGEGSRDWTFSCSSGSSGVGSCNCVDTTTTSPNPYYEQLVAAYNAEPETMDQQLSTPMSRVKVTQVTEESCDGSLAVALGANAQAQRLSYAAERRTWIVQSRANPRMPDGSPLEPVYQEGDAGEQDNRDERLIASTKAALGAWSPSVDDVRAMYGGGVSKALKSKDLVAARDALLWSEPALISTDAAGLSRFRQVWMSDAPTAFPAAWR